MRPDPRCPSCGEKVSATATWCMHCSADFDAPVDAERGGARMERATAATAEPGTGSDASDAAAVDETRATVIAAGLGVFAWILVAAVVPTVDWAGLLALAAIVALVFHLRTLPSPVDMLVHAGYGTAAVMVGLQFYVGTASPGTIPAVDGGTLFWVVVLVFGARWADDNRDEFDVSDFETSSDR